jgi:hypothetical protein
MDRLTQLGQAAFSMPANALTGFVKGASLELMDARHERRPTIKNFFRSFNTKHEIIQRALFSYCVPVDTNHGMKDPLNHGYRYLPEIIQLTIWM